MVSKDFAQRIVATNPKKSFIVQAPAGSGKTELLVQRYLRLLGTVRVPEEIVALTFTRKAASEMRLRILAALQQAAQEDIPTTAHQLQTYNYAKAALLHSEQLNWQLLKQPSRLRIMTIDALCQMIAYATPLSENQIPYTDVTDNPEPYYQAAARACLEHAEIEPLYQPQLKQLLHHLDNRQDRVINLLSRLLTSRDQWLPILYITRDHDKTHFEHMLSIIEQDALTRFKEIIPLALRNELCDLTRQLAEVSTASQFNLLRTWQNYSLITRDQAVSLAQLLLTSSGGLRKQFDHHVGLKRDTCASQVYQKLRTESAALCAQLSVIPDFLATLLLIKDLPPTNYAADQWSILQALFSLLPLLVAQLHIIWNTSNVVDFTAISLQALAALSDEHHPTELALYLDNRINHFLIDEFQDTSLTQFELLTKLVAGWQANDGRSLFIVGDPMQSIYRFRQAEVGLFLKVKAQGIGALTLDYIELSCNFRTTSTLVNWVNQKFCLIFPSQDNIAAGAIAFRASDYTAMPATNTYIQAHQLTNSIEEALTITQVVSEQLSSHPEDNIAILVRYRSQLVEIIKMLRAKQIPFQGIDIELLATLPHLCDLWSLVQVLLMPANRLAWLSFLRSPFCGLSLAELHLIANFDRKKSIYHALAQLELLPLSCTTKERLQFIYNTLHNALTQRCHAPLVDWVDATFKQLHGDKIVAAHQTTDIEQFWFLLDRFSQGHYPNLEQLSIEFNKLYSRTSSNARLQIMTIHKAKGLEFDCVILPGLSDKQHVVDQPLWRWLRLPIACGEDVFLVSPIKAAAHEQCLVYNYLARLDNEKSHHELARLFYVATTRAKKRLYLFDYADKNTSGSFRSLITQQEFSKDSIQDPDDKYRQVNSRLPLLYKLPQAFYRNAPSLITSKTSQNTMLPVHSNARQLGIITHELLQWICNNHPHKMQDLPWQMIQNRLRAQGIVAEELITNFAQLQQQISQLFADPIGKWLIAAHSAECNEYSILINHQREAKTRIIDRSFIDQGKLWLIDFKTGSDSKEALAEHQAQLNEYANFFASMSALPIACGLYYLANTHWLTWEVSFPKN